MLELLTLLLGVLSAALRSRRDLVLENLLLRHQLAVAARPRRRSRLRPWDKLLWLLGRRFCADWRRHLVLVTPETVIRWHREGWHLFWRWRSRSFGGRPRLGGETRELIRLMSRDNRLWGTERIRGELLKLGIVVSNRSVRRYRWRGPDRPPSQSWRTFLANHRPRIWAADLLTVQTLTFRTLYVLVFVAHGRRELVHLAVTANPTAAWVWRQVINATPWGRTPAYLVRDRDAVYGADFARKAAGLGIRTLLTPVRAPRANAIAERLVGTLRRECLDHVIVVNERHLRAILSDFTRYYNADRPHQALGLDTPRSLDRPPVGSIRSRPVLGGLHHVYERAA
jgi:transposase InsO family protein